MTNKKRYTREEKIKYYTRKMLNAEHEMNLAAAKLEYIKSDKYQDWESDLEMELQEKRKQDAG